MDGRLRVVLRASARPGGSGVLAVSGARRLGVASLILIAGLMATAAFALWPLVRQTDFAFVEHVRRDVAYGWLWLQAATPLFALAITTGLGTAALAWRLAHPRAGQR